MVDTWSDEENANLLLLFYRAFGSEGTTVSIKCGSFDGTAYILKKKDARKLKHIIDEHIN